MRDPNQAAVAGTFWTRLPFLLAAALIAAAVGDPVVESIANSGVFGGHYADNNHTGIIPTLIVGAALVAEVLALRFIDIWRRARDGSPRSRFATAKALALPSSGRDIPFVFGLQIATLFVLESAEQLTPGGKLLGGTIWLGGPILFSLIAHLIIGVGATLALGASMRAIVRAFAAVVQTAVRFIWLAVARATGGNVAVDDRTAAPLRTQAPHVRQIGGRAPPLSPAPA